MGPTGGAGKGPGCTLGSVSASSSTSGASCSLVRGHFGLRSSFFARLSVSVRRVQP